MANRLGVNGLRKLEVGPFGSGLGFGTATILNAKGGLVRLGATKDGEGQVTTMNSEGKRLVRLGVTEDGEGDVSTWDAKGQNLVWLGAVDGAGIAQTFDPSGK